MKIGILTFHCAHNYGAVLQCYALQETLKNMGHDVEVINYRPNYLTRPYKPLNMHRVIRKNLLKALEQLLIQIITWRKRTHRFREFVQFEKANIQLSKWTGSTSQGMPQDYDIYIIGSDQVWNSSITHGPEPLYLANFPFPKAGKKYIGYAISMGKEIFSTSKEKEIICNALKNFDFLSVREGNLSILLQSYTPKKIYKVLDPTLLAAPSIWKNISKHPIKKKKSVVVYQVRRDKNTLRIANQIAKQINGEVIELVSIESEKSSFKKLYVASPSDFIGYMMYADYIITTSFHGTAFAIIFQKTFYCIRLNDGRDERSASLLASMGLTDRLIGKKDNPSIETIDYQIVNEKLNTLRQYSIDYLSQALR